MSDEHGNVVAPSAVGMPEGHPVTTEVRVELEDVGGSTRMVMTHRGIASDSPGAAGWAMAFDKLAARAEKEGLKLAPFIGIGCPGLIREDGSIDRGVQNLPGNWASKSVSLPAALNGESRGLEVRRPLPEWQAMGVRRVDGQDLPAVVLDASLLHTDDGEGPAYLVYGNFRVLMAWNRSTYFGLTGRQLADLIERG